MNEKMKKCLGTAALGVLLLVGFGNRDAIARALGRIYGNSLHIENEPRSSTSGNFTLGNDDAYIKGDLELDGNAYFDGTLQIAAPAVEALVAGSTITANACWSLKRISALSTVTLSTGVFTSTATAPAGCSMDIVNIGSSTITLPFTQYFHSTANIVLAASGTVRAVAVPGKGWFEMATSANF